MKMDVYTIPQDLQVKHNGNFVLYDYRSAEDHQRAKVVFTSNVFSFIIDGTKEVVNEAHTRMCEKDDFILMRSGRCIMTERAATTNGYRSILFFFSNDALSDFMKEHDINFAKHEDRRHTGVFRKDEYIKALVTGLENMATLDVALQERLLKAKFDELMIYLTATYGDSVLSYLSVDVDSAHQEFIKVVENNKYNKLTLSELAFLCNMSVSTFKRKFEEQYHAPPIKWFQDQRLDYAAFLLRSHTQTSSEVFAEAGYESLSNFIAAFKNKFGVTPKQYQLQ
ncbi:MAG: AraC family transcriptional regulator [Flavipsychrobacter sp.]